MKVAEATDKGVRLSIYQDDTGDSPRDWDNLGTMVCFHSRYNLGDKNEHKSGDFSGWHEIQKHLIDEHDAVVVLPLYLYDHSGLKMKVGSFQGLLPQGHAEFDSGQVGFIYCSRDKILEEYSVKKITKAIKEKVARVLEQEVKTYAQYLEGDVYGFVLEKVHDCGECGQEVEEHIDSCWGFYGHDWKENGIADHIGKEYEYLLDKLEDC